MLYVYGHHVPGYLPDSDPSEPLPLEDAREGLASELERHAEACFDAGDDLAGERLALAAALISGWTEGPGCWILDDGTALGRAYWLELAE